MVKVSVSATVTTDVYGSDKLGEVSLSVAVPEVEMAGVRVSSASGIERARDEVHDRLKQLRKEIDAQLDVAAEKLAKEERDRRREDAFSVA